jgi:hypothetical protein
MDTEMETPSPPEVQPVEKRSSRKIVLLATAGLVLVLLLGGAAFTAGRLLNIRAPGDGGRLAIGKPGSGARISKGGPGGVDSTYSLEFEPAEELPKTEADIHGVFTRKEDNSIFIGTGKVSVMVSAGKAGGAGAEANATTDYDGPVVEIVVTGDTTLYKDVTEMSPDKVEEGAPIQQEVAPGRVEEIDQNSMISVWGKKVGDRIIADVLLYSQPQFFSMPK